MKKPNQVLLLLFYSLVMSSGCKKDKEPTDPFAGLSNQLVCKINGVEWRSNEIKFSGFYDYTPTINSRYLFLDYLNGRQAMQIFINPPYNKTPYILNQTTLDYPTWGNPKSHIVFKQFFADLTPEEFYITNNVANGAIDFIQLDSILKIAKGKFSFTGKDQRTGKKLTITDGYFEYHQ